MNRLIMWQTISRLLLLVVVFPCAFVLAQDTPLMSEPDGPSGKRL